MSENTLPDNAINLDAILAKREEEVGSRDRFPFVFGGKTWWAMDPTLADDAWQDELHDLGMEEDEDGNLIESDDVDTVAIAEHYLGVDQWKKFVEAGGQSSYFLHALRIHAEQSTGKDSEGRPTRRSRSSRATRRQSKRR